MADWYPWFNINENIIKINLNSSTYTLANTLDTGGYFDF